MSARFDVFLSHASADQLLVEEVARRLAREGLKPWLDRWHLVPGEAWQPSIEAALADCSACAVFIGGGLISPWQNEEMRHAIDRRVAQGHHSFRVIPVLLPGVDRPERSKLPGFLVATTWVEFRESLDEPDAFHRLVCGIRGIEPGTGPGQAGAPFEGGCPYRGLEMFDVEHAPLFFGREALVEWLVDAFRRKPSGDEDRFLAIVGASGSGKSSLARAGLLAAMKRGAIDGSARWPRAICRPGVEPFLSLATALAPLAPPSVAGVVFDRVHGRKDGERTLHVAAGLALGEPPSAARLVVLIDQFEEVFTLCGDEATRRDLIANLLHASTVAGGRTVVVLTMRADFYPRCAGYAELAAALSDRQVLVGPMTDDELRRAIERPARLAGLEPEPGLVELLIDDLRGRPGALPLLQFALHELWQRREAHRLTIRAYREIGQIEGALRQKADAVHASFSPEQQEVCRRVFLRLVQPGEGSEDTRRRASPGELLPDDPAQAEVVRAVIARLSNPESRLLTASAEGTLEVAHEALIRAWPLLRSWVEADRAGLRVHRRLTEAAHEWAEAADKDAALYNGARLAVALEWAAAHPGEPSVLESSFLAASEAHERRRRHDEAERNRRLAEAERRRAEEAIAATARQRKLSRWLLTAALVAILLALAAGLQSWRANQASESARALTLVATSRQLAAQSTSERGKHLDRSLLLAVEALRKANTLEARDSLFKAIEARPGLATFLHADAGPVGAIAVSPDGSILAGACRYSLDESGVVLWDLRTRQRLDGETLTVSGRLIESLEFSPDGQTLAAGVNMRLRNAGEVILWDMSIRKHPALARLALAEGSVKGIAFAPHGAILAAGVVISGRNGVMLWDIETGKGLLKEPLPIGEGAVSGVAFSTDGTKLAAAFTRKVEGGVKLWDVRRREPLAGGPLVARCAVADVALSADGDTIAVTSNAPSGAGILLGSLAERTLFTDKLLTVPEGYVSSAAFSPDGKTIAAGFLRGEGGGAVLWDRATGKRVAGAPFTVEEGACGQVVFNRDGKTLAASFGSIGRGGVALWDTSTPTHLANVAFTVGERMPRGLALSPDGAVLAAGFTMTAGRSGPETVFLWDATRRKPVMREPLAVPEGAIRALAFSPDGKVLAATVSNSSSSGVVLWDRATRERLGEAPLMESNTELCSVAFSPDGTTFATGFALRAPPDRGSVRLWERATRKPLPRQPLLVDEGFISSVAFSPDGKTIAAGFAKETDTTRAGGVALWNVADGIDFKGRRLPVGEGSVRSVAFSSDGKLLVAGYANAGSGGVVLWNSATLERLGGKPIDVVDDAVQGIAFSPDGRILATESGFLFGEDVGGSHLWDVATRSRLVEQRLLAGQSTPGGIAFSPDGKTLAQAYLSDENNGGVVLWDLDLTSWQRHAGRMANRNFDEDEWPRYFPDQPYRPTFDDLPVPRQVQPRVSAKRY